MVARSRMPPPSWVGMVSTVTIASMAALFFGSPAKAPSRSTMWSSSAPCRCHSTGLSGGVVAEYGVLLHQPLFETDAFSFLQIDCGNDYHVKSLRNFSVSAIPSPGTSPGGTGWRRYCPSRWRNRTRCRTSVVVAITPAVLGHHVIGMDEVDVGIRPRCRRRPAAALNVSWFHPMWGTFSDSPVSTIPSGKRTTRPGMMPRPL